MQTPLRILIADDEPAARRHLLRQLGRSSVPHEVVAEAASGPQLLACARAQAVDVILLDIMMPGLSGLDALRQLSSLAPQPEVIIISAYDRFEFAQDALRLGVRDFLLKPVRSGQLDESLAGAARRWEQRKKRENQSQLWEQHRSSYQNNVYRQLLLGDAVDPAAAELGSDSFPLMLLAFDLPGPDRSRLTARASAWADDQGGRLLWIRPGRGVILLSARTVSEQGKHSACALLEHLHPQSHIAYSGRVDHHDELASHYRLLCRALALAYVTGKNPLGTEELTPRQNEDRTVLNLYALRGRLAAQVQSGSPAQALALMEQLVKQAATEGSQGVEFLTLELIAALSIACQVASEHHPDPRHLQQLETRTLQRLLETGSAPELVEITVRCLEEVFAAMIPSPSGRHELVARARAYIKEHAPEPLTLGEVAQAVYISPYYLSHLFRELEDTTFQDCLIAERMKKAQQLLGRTHLSSQEVARAVGYQSASHFSQLFKRTMGLSPSAFRRREERDRSREPLAADPTKRSPDRS